MIFIPLAVAAVVGYVVWQVLKFRKYGGKMLVTCPETGKPAAVRISVPRAVWAALRGRRALELSACSRWPERADCDQECLCEVEANPEAHQAWTIASQWFAGKKCAYCGNEIQPVKHLDRLPALVNLDKKTFQWDQIPTEELPQAFEACKPVCWSCHIAETFVREHPDLVTFRPWKKGGPVGEYVSEKKETKEKEEAAPPRAA
jgi:hypothetical protein